MLMETDEGLNARTRKPGKGVWLPCQPAATTLPHGPLIFTTDHVHRKWAFPGVRSKCIQSVQKEGIDGWHTCAFKLAEPQ